MKHVDPLPEATSGILALVRVLSKNFKAVESLWGLNAAARDGEEQINERKNQWRCGSRGPCCKDVPCFLPVDDYYRPTAVSLEDFESLWRQTRGEFTERQIPRDDIDMKTSTSRKRG